MLSEDSIYHEIIKSKNIKLFPYLERDFFINSELGIRYLSFHNYFIKSILDNLNSLDKNNIEFFLHKILQINKFEFTNFNIYRNEILSIWDLINNEKYFSYQNDYSSFKKYISTYFINKDKINYLKLFNHFSLNDVYLKEFNEDIPLFCDNIYSHIYKFLSKGGNNYFHFLFEKEEEKLEIDIKYDFDNLYSLYPNFKDVTSYFENICNKKKLDDYVKPVMIHTTNNYFFREYLKELSLVLKSYIHFERMNNVQLSGSLLGHDKTWSEATVGTIYTKYINKTNKKIIYVMQDFDLTDVHSYSHNYSNSGKDLGACFSSLFTYDGLLKYRDNFIAKEKDITDYIFIASARLLNNISEDVVSNCVIIKEQDFTDDEIVKVSQLRFQKAIIDLPEDKKEQYKKVLSVNKNDIPDWFKFVISEISAINISFLDDFIYNFLDYVEINNIRIEDINLNKLNFISDLINNVINFNFSKLDSNYKVSSPNLIDVDFSKIYGSSSIKNYVIDYMNIYKTLVDISKNRFWKKDNKSFLIQDQLKGIIFYGNPGVGKTIIAKAFAKECNVPFVYMNGNSFKDDKLGGSSNKVKDFFNVINKLSSCVIYIDEIDALGNREYSSYDDGAINELLVHLDGFATNKNKNILFIASTNHLKNVDSALIRSGRFDKKIKVDKPTYNDRVEIIKNMILNDFKGKFKDINCETIAQFTYGLG